ncbi:Chitin synthase, class 3 [Ceratobasidium sp. 395]|nr:Chitin synthase, class 3 [Ceratobasidium sp. 395]
MPSATGSAPQGGLRGGKSLLGRDEETGEAGLFKRSNGNALRRKHPPSAQGGPTPNLDEATETRKPGFFDNIGPDPKDAWFIYCYMITCCVPRFLLSSCGIRTLEQQRAWREKIGLLAIIISLMASVGFITFGFTQIVCGKPAPRVKAYGVGNGSLIIHGFAYDLADWKHPKTAPYFDGTTSPLYAGDMPSGGADASFLFQRPNDQCSGLLSVPQGSSLALSGSNPQWIFPCNGFSQFGNSIVNKTGYNSGKFCHTGASSRSQLDGVANRRSVVYYTWEQVAADNRNLAIYESNVLDLDLLNWLDQSRVTVPQFFTDIQRKASNSSFAGRDMTMHVYRSSQKRLANCLKDLVTVGFIDTSSIGCVASEVVLYVSLVFIIGVVSIKFAMAVIFGWFLSWRLGSFGKETYAERMQRSQAIENWTDDIYRPAPGAYRPNANQAKWAAAGKDKGKFLPSTSRFSCADGLKGAPGRPTTTYGDATTYRRANTGTTATAAKLVRQEPARFAPHSSRFARVPRESEFDVVAVP